MARVTGSHKRRPQFRKRAFQPGSSLSLFAPLAPKQQSRIDSSADTPASRVQIGILPLWRGWPRPGARLREAARLSLCRHTRWRGGAAGRAFRAKWKTWSHPARLGQVLGQVLRQVLGQVLRQPGGPRSRPSRPRADRVRLRPSIEEEPVTAVENKCPVSSMAISHAGKRM